MLRPHFTIELFDDWFRGENRKRLQGVKDPPIIEFCHDKNWLLLTTDHNMRKTHEDEIRRHPRVTVLATAHNCFTPQEYKDYLSAVIKLKPKILRHFKKFNRPWFAKFTREAHDLPPEK